MKTRVKNTRRGSGVASLILATMLLALPGAGLLRASAEELRLPKAGSTVGELQTLQRGLRSEAKALEDRVSEALERIHAGEPGMPVEEFVRDLVAFSKTADHAAEGIARYSKFSGERMAETSATLRALGADLTSAGDSVTQVQILESIQNSLFWGFRG